MLTKFWTLTYAPDHLPASLAAGWADIEDFRRRIPKKWGPIIMVPEWGEESGRFHWHFLVGTWIKHSELERLWGRGQVWVEGKIKVKPGEGPPGRRAQARKAAAYCSKYIAKSFDGGQEGTKITAGREAGCKRYSTTKGTKVEPRRLRFQTLEEALGFAMKLIGEGGGGVTGSWRSEDAEDWQGPPVWMIHFDDPPEG